MELNFVLFHLVLYTILKECLTTTENEIDFSPAQNKQFAEATHCHFYTKEFGEGCNQVVDQKHNDRYRYR